MEIYLIRHTKPKVEEGVCYGQTDVPLLDTFEEEWSQLKGKLPECFDSIYTSPLRRCLKLANLVKADALTMDDRLLELDFGDWEMKKWNEIHKDDWETWTKNFIHVAAPNGESYHDLFHRVAAFLNDLYATSFNRVAVIAHAGTIRAIVAHMLDLALDKSFNLEFSFGKVSLIEISGQLKKVKYLNV